MQMSATGGLGAAFDSRNKSGILELCSRPLFPLGKIQQFPSHFPVFFGFFFFKENGRKKKTNLWNIPNPGVIPVLSPLSVSPMDSLFPEFGIPQIPPLPLVFQALIPADPAGKLRQGREPHPQGRDRRRCRDLGIPGRIPGVPGADSNRDRSRELRFQPGSEPGAGGSRPPKQLPDNSRSFSLLPKNKIPKPPLSRDEGTGNPQKFGKRRWKREFASPGAEPGGIARGLPVPCAGRIPEAGNSRGSGSSRCSRMCGGRGGDNPHGSLAPGIPEDPGVPGNSRVLGDS